MEVWGIEGGLVGWAEDHFYFYFPLVIFHNKKTKEVNEGYEGANGIDSLRQWPMHSPLFPSLLCNIISVLWLFLVNPVRGSDMGYFLAKVVKSGYNFSLSLPANNNLGNHTFWIV